MHKSPEQIQRALNLLDLLLSQKVVIENLSPAAVPALRSMGTTLFWVLHPAKTPQQAEGSERFETLLDQIEKAWAAAQDHQALNE